MVTSGLNPETIDKYRQVSITAINITVILVVRDTRKIDSN